MKPTNTSKLDPFQNLMEHAFMGGVEMQESRGQRQLVQGESLPTTCTDRTALEAAGVVFGAPYSDDKLFCPVTLPAGWKKQATDHAMHSKLIDDKGRIRASIFYKAASYDRRADMYATKRYGIDAYAPVAGKDRDWSRVVAKDGETIIQEFGETCDYDGRDELRKLAAAWLNEKFPQWESPAAYWDQP